MEFLTFVVILGRQVLSNDQPGFMLLDYTNFPSQDPRFLTFFLGCTCWLCRFRSRHFFFRQFLPQPSLSHRLVCAGFEIWNLWSLGLKGRRSHSNDTRSGSWIQGTSVYVIYIHMIYDLYNWLIEVLYIVILHRVHAMVEIDGRNRWQRS